LLKAQARQAERVHKLEMLKAEGVHEIDTLRFDPDVIAYAKHIRAGQEEGVRDDLNDVIESLVKPWRAKFLADFDAPSTVEPAAPVGPHESEFNRILGGGK
jgi:hypothetical protein